MTVALSADEARRLCANAGLTVISVDVCAAYTLIRVEALTVTPETVVKRLWAAGAYAVQIGVENGGVIVTLAAKGE